MFIPKPIYFVIMITCSAICLTALIVFFIGLIRGLIKGRKNNRG